MWYWRRALGDERKMIWFFANDLRRKRKLENGGVSEEEVDDAVTHAEEVEGEALPQPSQAERNAPAATGISMHEMEEASGRQVRRV